MTKEQAKEIICKVVNSQQGMKMSHLIAHEEIIPLILEDYEVTELVDELIKEGNLVDVQYILPNMNYRLKMFLLPAGTILGTSSADNLNTDLNGGRPLNPNDVDAAVLKAMTEDYYGIGK